MCHACAGHITLVVSCCEAGGIVTPIFQMRMSRLKKVTSMAQIQMAGKSVEELGFQVTSWTLAPHGLAHMCHIQSTCDS